MSARPSRPPNPDPTLKGSHSAVGPLRRLARAVRGARPVGPDRFDELACIARMSGAVYWEQDTQGRYTRIDRAAPACVDPIGSLLGRARWEIGVRIPAGRIPGSAPAGIAFSDWTAHLQAFANRESFSDLIWELPRTGGSLPLRESGRPRFTPGGDFIGYTGLIREAVEPVTRDLASAALRNALQLAPMPFMQIQAADEGVGCRATWVNSAGCALFGHSEAEILAADPSSLFDGNAGDCHAAIAAAVSGATSLRRPAVVLDAQGKTRPVVLRVDPIHAPRPLPAQALLSLDPFQPELDAVRARLESAELALADSASARRELESAASELELFSSAVSHDLRAPLRVVDGFAAILREDFAGVLGRFGIDHVERIIAATARMNRMIDALLKLAKVSSEPIGHDIVDLSALSRSIVEELHTQDPERQVDVEIEPSMRAIGDRTLLRIVLENLIGNAWKYTGHEASPRIRISCSDASGSKVYCVSDNGAGFDMRFADRLFRVFQRLHSASEFKGTGVGLATVSRIIRRHHGRIWAQSAPGEGARFHFTLNEDPAGAGAPGQG